MEASEVVVQRFLAAFEQAVWVKLPSGWEKPRPAPALNRQTAAVLLRTAELPSLQEMKGFLEGLAGRLGARAAAKGKAGEDRQGEEGGQDRTGGFWPEMVGLLDRLPRGHGPSLFDLEICRGQRWTRPLARVLAEAQQPVPPPIAETLAALARILLRAKARQLTLDELRRERAEPQVPP